MRELNYLKETICYTSLGLSFLSIFLSILFMSISVHMRVYIYIYTFFANIIAQNNGTIKVGHSLTEGDDNTQWLSPSKDFAFGFQSLQNDHFLPAIWYHKVEHDPIVWYAMNEDKPALGQRQSKLELINANKGLLLRDPQGVQLWNYKH